MAESEDSTDFETYQKERIRQKDRARKNTDKVRAQRRARYAANEKFRQNQQQGCRAYYRKNATKLAAGKRAARAADPDKTREFDRLRYWNNREKHFAEVKAYYVENREARLEYARKRNAVLRAARHPRPPPQTNKDRWERWIKRQEQIAGRPKPECCEICASRGINGRLVFDHDHRTGKFRGWICHLCNLALGNVKEDVTILLGLIEYLKHHS